MQIKIINNSTHALPNYESLDAAGMDLRANIIESIQLLPMQRQLIGTGIHIALPTGYEAQIRSRSGLAYKQGIVVFNSPGTIDADYRGEIKILLMNFSDQPFIINNGDRIAQIVIAKHEKVIWKTVELLEDTSRGQGGYGSTGI